jgi:hypothetical protein
MEAVDFSKERLVLMSTSLKVSKLSAVFRYFKDSIASVLKSLFSFVDEEAVTLTSGLELAGSSPPLSSS